MVYNSWITMQALGETDPDTCAFNDFALVRLDPADAGKVNPSIPFFGGPTGLDTNGTAVGESVLSYGNSSLRLGISQLSPKRGVSVGDAGNGWSHGVLHRDARHPGRLGQRVRLLRRQGARRAQHVAIAPLAGSNGVGDLAKELAYLGAHTSFAVQLALGTEPFNPNRLV